MLLISMLLGLLLFTGQHTGHCSVNATSNPGNAGCQPYAPNVNRGDKISEANDR